MTGSSTPSSGNGATRPPCSPVALSGAPKQSTPQERCTAVTAWLSWDNCSPRHPPPQVAGKERPSTSTSTRLLCRCATPTPHCCGPHRSAPTHPGRGLQRLVPSRSPEPMNETRNPKPTRQRSMPRACLSDICSSMSRPHWLAGSSPGGERRTQALLDAEARLLDAGCGTQSPPVAIRTVADVAAENLPAPAKLGTPTKPWRSNRSPPPAPKT